MREYVLTNQEKQIIQKYLETGEKSKGFRKLLSRTRHMQTVNSDLELIKQFLAKVEGASLLKQTVEK